MGDGTAWSLDDDAQPFLFRPICHVKVRAHFSIFYEH